LWECEAYDEPDKEEESAFETSAFETIRRRVHKKIRKERRIRHVTLFIVLVILFIAITASVRYVKSTVAGLGKGPNNITRV
jgi:fatty acid desaturase